MTNIIVGGASKVQNLPGEFVGADRWSNLVGLNERSYFVVVDEVFKHRWSTMTKVNGDVDQHGSMAVMGISPVLEGIRRYDEFSLAARGGMMRRGSSMLKKTTKEMGFPHLRQEL
ncbi:hypothetical protein ACLOJK_030230 [Asimina triloba]